MNNFSKFLLFTIIAAGFSSIGWNNFGNGANAGNITDYYYCEGKRYYVVHRPDMIFIKLNKTMEKNEFEDLFSSYGRITNEYQYASGELRQFIKINSTLDNTALNSAINQLRTFAQVDYASPVFGIREGMGNANTLLGCEGNIIVQFKPSLKRNQIDSYLSSKNMTVVQEFELTGGLSFLVKVPRTENLSALDYANEVYASGLVNYCSPDFLSTNLVQFVPDDPFFPSQWSAINTGSNIPVIGTGTADCDMGLDSAWDQTLGSPNCIVSIVDTGIDTTHPDMSANVLHGYNFNYFTNTYGGIDDFGHGASCAGIVAAVGNNSLGISGVCPNAKVFSAKIFASNGSSTTAGIINALIGVRTFGNCWVSNNSWGGGSEDPGIINAIDDGVTLGRGGKGIIWCFATGNSNASTISFPSNRPNVISVGGVSPCEQRKSPSSCDNEGWWGSQYGTGTDIVAPCVKIYATVQGGGYTNSFNGTSSATPNTSGVCALMLSKDSTQSWDTVRARLNRTALKKGAYSYTSAGPLPQLGNTWNNEMGYGVVNANLALLAVSQPLANDVITGPYLSFPASFKVNTSYNIRSKVSNGGTAGQTNVPLKFFVNGVQTGSTINIASLPAGANDSVTFSWTPAVTGAHTLKIAHGLAVDGNRNNDTVTAVINVQASGIGNGQTGICRNGLNKPILDLQTTRDTINVNIPNSFNIIDVNVKIDTVDHGYDGDLQFTLTHLAANSMIVNQVGGSNDNFRGTILNDSATTPIASGVAPFTGSFIPSNPLTVFNGTVVNGPWVLSIFDVANVDEGSLKAWCLIITYQTILGGVQSIEIPNYFSLGQNYPNPFNPTTSIKFSLPKAELVSLKVYDVLGKEVAVLVNEMKEPGFYNVDFNGSNMASGIYFYRIEAGEFSAVKKLMLVK